MSRTYRVMIIDDEESARKLMRAGIRWEDFGMEVVGEAASGIEAINVIDDYKPDLVFVDISMPFMNGIEFAETVTDRYPSLIIIIMTAFDEFEYARKCVSLPVFEYMLKPMVRDEVAKVLQRARIRLDRANETYTDDDRADTETDIDGEGDSIDKIRKYIDENFTDSTLNLAFAAKYFGFSSSYLSRKFKQETGKNFVEYLTELRMKKAIKLARSNIKMYRTAAEVGIPDPNYFGRCFKKYTGMSYSDYMAENGK